MNAAMRMIGGMLVLIFSWPVGVWAAGTSASSQGGSASLPAVNNPFDAASLGQFVLGLLVVVGMILVLAWMLRRMNRIQGSVQGQMRILAGLPLGSRERVVLVQVGEEQVLIGVAPGRVSRLHVLEHPLELKSATSSEAGESFRSRLAAAMQRRPPQ